MSASANIYVVENEEATRKSLESAVKSIGFYAQAFHSAEALLNSIDKDSRYPACVITDVRLPGMSGIELLQAMGKAGVCFSAIIVTASAETPLTVAAMRLGAFTVIDKPFSVQQLLDDIKAALDQAQQRHETHGRMEEVRGRLAELTTDEERILEMLMEGKPNKAMAIQLKLSVRTIENRRRQIYDKMGSYSVPELVRKVVELNVRDELRELSLRT